MQNNCYPAFCAEKFDDKTTARTRFQTINIWCREYEKFEIQQFLAVQLLMQLGCGLFDSNEWVEIMMRYKNGKDCAPDNFQGSHSCGNGSPIAEAHEDNGGCVNVFCVVWKIVMNKIPFQI
jgi:hypothetical protein